MRVLNGASRADCQPSVDWNAGWRAGGCSHCRRAGQAMGDDRGVRRVYCRGDHPITVLLLLAAVRGRQTDQRSGSRGTERCRTYGMSIHDFNRLGYLCHNT